MNLAKLRYLKRVQVWALILFSREIPEIIMLEVLILQLYSKFKDRILLMFYWINRKINIKFFARLKIILYFTIIIRILKFNVVLANNITIY